MASAPRLRKPKTKPTNVRLPMDLRTFAVGIANNEYEGSLSDYFKALIKADKAARQRALDVGAGSGGGQVAA